MKVFPAIDLYNNTVVRLEQGDYSKRKAYNPDPLEWAGMLYRQGFSSIHLIDLEGAQKGIPCHLKILEHIAAMGFTVHYGGGLRTSEAIEKAVKHGAHKVYLGSILAKSHILASRLTESFREHIIPAVDVRNDMVAISGWSETSSLSYFDFITRLASLDLSTFLVTSIAKDGLQKGPDLQLYRKVIKLFPECNLIAAGGITVLKDIEDLQSIGCWGAILGKSLYEQTLSFDELRKVWL